MSCLLLASCGGGGSSAKSPTTVPPTVTTNPAREAVFLAALAKNRGRIDVALSQPNVPVTDQVLLSQAYAWCAAVHGDQTTWKELRTIIEEKSGHAPGTEWVYDIELVLDAAKAHLC